ncbi:hypothetical protein VTN02DRAFT_1048 [Thermoascus thermophilus]
MSWAVFALVERRRSEAEKIALFRRGAFQTSSTLQLFHSSVNSSLHQPCQHVCIGSSTDRQTHRACARAEARMAARFGERLLAEVRGERLDELLHDLRALHPRSTPAPSLGVRELDELLDAFLGRSSSSSTSISGVEQQDPEQHQDQAAPQPGERVEHALPAAGLHVPSNPGVSASPRRRRQRDPVVEIASASSAAGKTQLLYYLTAVAVLPARFGGREAAVVFLDTDGRFDAARLRDVAASILRQRLDDDDSTAVDIPPDVLQAEIRTALDHVHLFRPQSSSSLLATLRSLDAYLLDLAAHRSPAPRRSAAPPRRSSGIATNTGASTSRSCIASWWTR